MSASTLFSPSRNPDPCPRTLIFVPGHSCEIYFIFFPFEPMICWAIWNPFCFWMPTKKVHKHLPALSLLGPLFHFLPSLAGKIASSTTSHHFSFSFQYVLGVVGAEAAAMVGSIYSKATVLLLTIFRLPGAPSTVSTVSLGTIETLMVLLLFLLHDTGIPM